MLGSGDGSGLALSEGDPVAPQLPRINHFGFRLEHDQAVSAARERLRGQPCSCLMNDPG